MKLIVFGPAEHIDSVELFEKPETLGLEEEGVSLGEIKAVCNIIRDPNVVRVKLKTFVNADFCCSRCVEDFSRVLVGEVSFVVRRLNKGEQMPEIRETDDIDQDDLVMIECDYNAVDIDDYVRDAVILSIPSKPVCDENCKGLCPHCGKNLNTEKCSCSETKSDSRWVKLKKIDGN